MMNTIDVVFEVSIITPRRVSSERHVRQALQTTATSSPATASDASAIPNASRASRMFFTLRSNTDSTAMIPAVDTAASIAGVVGAGPPLVEPVAGHDHCAHRADRPGLVDGGDPEHDGAEHREDEGERRRERQQNPKREAPVVAAREAHRRRGARPQKGRDQDVGHVEADQHQPRQEGPHEHVARARGG